MVHLVEQVLRLRAPEQTLCVGQPRAQTHRAHQLASACMRRDTMQGEAHEMKGHELI